jgi:hypothetical protein
MNGSGKHSSLFDTATITAIISFIAQAPGYYTTEFITNIKSIMTKALREKMIQKNLFIIPVPYWLCYNCCLKSLKISQLNKINFPQCVEIEVFVKKILFKIKYFKLII